MLVYFLILFFFLFKQPHAFTSMDKDSFFSPFTFENQKQIKNIIRIRKPLFSPPNLCLAALEFVSLRFVRDKVLNVF